MGSGDSPGLQNRRTASFGVVGGFDSHSLPPTFRKVLRYAQDFTCGLPLCSRPQNGSSSTPTRFRQLSARSFATLRISPAGSRFAHARKTAQVRLPLASADFPQGPSLRSGFQRAALCSASPEQPTATRPRMGRTNASTTRDKAAL